MTKHVEKAYDVEEGDRVKFSTDQDLTVKGTVIQSEKIYPGGPEVTAEVERFEIEADEGKVYSYVINNDYGSDTGYSPVMDREGTSKENFEEESYGYIVEIEVL